MTPHRLFLAVVSALAARRVETLAGLLRVFTHQQGVRVAYEAFYNRLARPGLEACMRAMCGRWMRDCRLQTLEPDGDQAVAPFRDIVIQDGFSWAVKQGRRLPVAGHIRLSRVLARYAGVSVDLDIEGRKADHAERFRLVVTPGRAGQTSRLCTNLSRSTFSAALVARLYRFRWQIERCFKEWKSYANLHPCDTANPHIAAGLMWAGLCAALWKRFLAHAAQRVGNGAAMSTRRVAMCAHLLLTDVVAALVKSRGLRKAWQHPMAYLLANAGRANVPREPRIGRLRSGVVLVGGA